MRYFEVVFEGKLQPTAEKIVRKFHIIAESVSEAERVGDIAYRAYMEGNLKTPMVEIRCVSVIAKADIDGVQAPKPLCPLKD